MKDKDELEQIEALADEYAVDTELASWSPLHVGLVYWNDEFTNRIE
jgi:hypothetical protein